MDTIVSNITVVNNVVRSNIYEGIRTVFVGAQTKIVRIIATGTDSYSSAALVGKSILLVFTDNLKRDATDYTVNSTTGTILFNQPRDLGEVIELLVV